MKRILLAVLLAGLIFPARNLFGAQTNAPDAPAVAVDKEQATLEKHTKPVLAALKLTDADQEAKVHEIMVSQLKALKTWHTANDAQIKVLWSDFDKARSAKNKADANAALEKIGAVYATFQPQHKKFISALSTVLTPAQVETVKDALTINKVKVTYDAYLQIFPMLTDEEKAEVLTQLKAAREEAIDCEKMTEISAFFKKYKIKIEDDYFAAEGINAQQARKDFAARQKSEKTAPSDTATKPAEAAK